MNLKDEILRGIKTKIGQEPRCILPVTQVLTPGYFQS